MTVSQLVSGILASTVIFSVPLMLVALGGMFSERSGTINIALEGIMIIGALSSCLFLNKTNITASHPLLGMSVAILIAAAAGGPFSLLLGFAAINLRADQTIGGTALNILAPALAIQLTWLIQGQGQTVINIKNVRITQAMLGLTASENPGFFENLIFKYLYLTTPVAIVLLIVSIIVLYKTRFGFRLRACGEHPQAADSVGINVYKMRYAGVVISGVLGGIGGLAFTVAAGSGFQSSVAGYGFLALSVMIFGNWKPVNIMLASLFFALFKVIGGYKDYIPFLPKFSNITASENIYSMLPYILTMVVLIFTSRRSRAPKAEGIPYDKGAR